MYCYFNRFAYFAHFCEKIVYATRAQGDPRTRLLCQTRLVRESPALRTSCVMYYFKIIIINIIIKCRENLEILALTSYTNLKYSPDILVKSINYSKKKL